MNISFRIAEPRWGRTAKVMQDFAETGRFTVDADVMARAADCLPPTGLMMKVPLPGIANTAKQDGMVIDPHSAVGLSAARRAHADGVVDKDVPIVSLACAHPAKFETAVKTAIGTEPTLPPHLTDPDVATRTQTPQ